MFIINCFFFWCEVMGLLSLFSGQWALFLRATPNFFHWPMLPKKIAKITKITTAIIVKFNC